MAWQDRYKIRKSFTCRPGNSLIVADYGQLELRLLAHMVSSVRVAPLLCTHMRLAPVLHFPT